MTTFSLWISDEDASKPVRYALNDGKVYANYLPKAPEVDAISVSETIRLTFTIQPSTTSLVLLQGIERLVDRARRFQQTRRGNRIYLILKAAHDNQEWRSEILAGKLEYSAGSLTSHYSNNIVIADLLLERKAYWEGAEAELPLLNYHTNLAVPGGVAIDNHYDHHGVPVVYHDNTVFVIGGLIEGTLPTPIKLKFDNIDPQINRVATLYVGQRTEFSQSASFTHLAIPSQMLEGEDGGAGAVWPAIPDYTLYSSGQYNVVGLDDHTVHILGEWTLDSATLTQMEGDYFRLLLGCAQITDYTGLWFKSKVIMDLSTLYESDWAQAVVGSRLVDLGALPLPPYLRGSGQPIYNMKVQVSAYLDATGTPTQTVCLDCLQLTPLDGWRKYACTSYQLDTDDILIDDGITETLYIDYLGTGVMANWYVAYGRPLVLTPGKHSIFYFLAECNSGAYDPMRVAEVSIFYRPRRATL